MVRPCEENEIGAHSDNNARRGHTEENKKREADGKMHVRYTGVYMTEAVLTEDNATNTSR